jgi:hypothetical protein
MFSNQGHEAAASLFEDYWLPFQLFHEPQLLRIWQTYGDHQATAILQLIE